MWRKGNKVNYKNCVFDSQKEFFFYQRFLEKYDDDPDSEFIVKIHPNYEIIEKFKISGVTIRDANFKPDFVIEDHHGKILHIYDVKNGFSAYAIDQAAKLRFKLFTKRYKVPVEAVVIRKNDFKVKVYGTTKKTQEHIFKDIDYSWQEAVK